MVTDLNQINQTNERDFFRRLIDGELTDEAFLALQERLRADPEMRTRYVRYVGFESAIRETISSSLPLFSGQRQNTLPSRELRTEKKWRAVAIAAVACLAILPVLWANVVTTTPHALFPATPDMIPAATVTEVAVSPAQVPAGLKLGARCYPGLLKIPSGHVDLDFYRGARVQIEGPAILRILSPDSITLLAGKVAAKINPTPDGFVLNIPSASIVGLGSKFAVAVDDAGATDIRVQEGRVEVSLLSDDRQLLQSCSLDHLETVHVHPGAQPRLEKLVRLPTSMPQISNTALRPLPVPEAYVQAVRDAGPAVYWRFDEVVNAAAPNEMGMRFAGVIHSSAGKDQHISVTQGMVVFSPSPGSIQWVEVDEPIPDLNLDSFTVEFWVNPAYYHRAVLAATLPAIDEPLRSNEELHLNLVELRSRPESGYETGVFQFLHRDPPGQTGGTRLFSSGECVPGQWHHLACTKSASELRLYVNGRMVRQVVCESPVGVAGPYRLTLGCLYPSAADRAFSGAIDEFAVYRNELSQTQVESHWQLMALPQKH